jgi:SAM-dependent methyltransferase
MLRIARARGIQVVRGTGEALPFATDSVDVVLLVTTVCFLEDLDRALGEARRVLRPGGSLVVGLVDRASPLGAEYLARKEESLFYRAARFYTVEEILQTLVGVGFGAFETHQTLFGPPTHTPADETVRHGHGKGSFVAVRGRVLAGRSQHPPSIPGSRRTADTNTGEDGGR